MQAITVNDQLFYSADELKPHYKDYFKGTSRGARYVIDRHEIAAENYIYGKKRNEVWCESNATYKLAKVLLKKEFCENNIFISRVKKEEKKKEDVPIAPPRLFLEEEEMFKDAEGQPVDIEVRGEREEDKIFFYCKDVAEKFGISDLNKSLLRSHTSYSRNEDFVLLGRVDNVHSEPIKSIFLTYQGLLKVLFVSRNKNANVFRKWATKILFTSQMGTQEQKDKLGAALQNVNYKNFRSVFRQHANKMSAIYLITIGKVADVRSIFKIPSCIPDESCLYKYGYTDDLSRRFREHCNTYDKMDNVKINLEMFSFVDPKFNSQAEVDVKNIFEGFAKDFTFEQQKELVILNKNEEVTAKKLFRMISREYAGCSEEMQKRIAELKAEIDMLKQQHIIALMEVQNELEMEKKDNAFLKEKHVLELENAKKDVESLKKELRIKELEQLLRNSSSV